MTTKGRALCKYAGALITAEFTVTNWESKSCPFCASDKKFYPFQGWLECPDCSFAILEEHYDKLTSQLV